MTPVERSGEAAVRVLAARVNGAELSRFDVEQAGWVAGAAGRVIPALRDPIDHLHAQQAALFGAGDGDAGFDFVERHVETRDARLRLLARTDLRQAEIIMLSYARSWGYDQQDAGTEAVLARLVRSDPERASAIVAGREDPENRVEWLDPLVHGHVLPVSAEPVVDALLDLRELESVYALARILIAARAWSRLERALANIAGDPAMDVAAGVELACRCFAGRG